MGILGTTNFTKLAGETDFNDLVDKLFQVESRYANQLIKWRDDWKQRIDAFGKVRTQLASLRSALGGINTVDKFLLKTATSSKTEYLTAKAEANALPGTYEVEINQLAKNNRWSIETGLVDQNGVINTSGVEGKFVYNYKGKDYTVAVPPGTTLKGLQNLINNNSTYEGVQATIIQSGTGAVFQLNCKESGEAAPMFVKETQNLACMPLTLTDESWTFDATGAMTSTFGTTNPTDSINTTTANLTFTFLLDGKKSTFSVAPGKSLDDLAGDINTHFPDPPNKGFKAEVVLGGDGKHHLKVTPGTIEKKATEKNNEVNILERKTFTNQADFETEIGNVGENTTFSLKLDGKIYSITKTGKFKYSDVVNDFKDENGKNIFVAETAGDGTIKVKINPDLTRNRSILPTSEGSLDDLDFKPPKAAGWVIQNAQNARFRVDGMPTTGWLESTSNEVKGAVEGITFNLLSENSKATITVGIDSEGVMKNVQTFVDSVNELRKVINELSAVDKDKTVLKPEVAESQFEMQKGGLLTGNYGVQLINSKIKQVTAGIAPGFMHAVTKDKVLVNGDRFSSLGNVGIITNAKESDPNFGMLEIKMLSDGKALKSFSQALEEDPLAVAELFAAQSQGMAHSSSFGYFSHVANLTKPGTYDVSYTIEEDPPTSGTFVPKNILINGKPGKYYPDTKQIGLGAEEKNDASGIILDIFDWSPGPKTGSISIRDGKVNELIDMLDGSEGLLNSQNGALGILERNYKKIADNIDKKIISEDERLKKWASHMRLRFARLEGTLAFYNAKQDGLKSQLNQLKSSSS